ncbi:histone-arginine methyltransferase CARM1-like [Sinocyclocheilus rhinocerous]|uniref:histone-arginine methyltransferase CARM1-like n=1 Tax=Sinocyclocheilus rhinocerous TaxID=307959 RepID=UPI0007B7DEB8|nr:PREDICTED: histone-arginine methyltransferase CARM1-like [Sinocyclocheilus rhinocerous]
MGDNQFQSSFSVTLVSLNESDMKQELPLSRPLQELTLLVHREMDDFSLSINDDAGVCVFKFSITRDTECCRVATRSFLITLGCFSTIMRFTTQSEFEIFHRMLRSWHELRRDQSVFQQRTDGSSALQYFQTLVKSNNLSNKITVLSGKIEEVSCSEKVDVIISEPMGYMLLNERMLESYLHAKNWLKPKGMMFPTQGDIHLAPFTDEQLYMEHHARSNFWNQRCFYGVNLSGLHSSAVDEFFRQPIVDTFDMQILMARSVKYTINFLEAKEEDLHRLEIPFVFKLLQSGLIHGLAFWFDVAFVGSRMTVWLSTAPNEPLTQWYQVRCLLQTPLFAKMGQTLSGRVQLIANKRQSYDIHITALVDQSGFKSGNSLDLKNNFFR